MRRNSATQNLWVMVSQNWFFLFQLLYLSRDYFIHFFRTIKRNKSHHNTLQLISNRKLKNAIKYLLKKSKKILQAFRLWNTAWRVSKCGVFSGPYFPVFRLNTGKYGPEKTPCLDTFHAMKISLLLKIPIRFSRIFKNQKNLSEWVF